MVLLRSCQFVVKALWLWLAGELWIDSKFIIKKPSLYGCLSVLAAPPILAKQNQKKIVKLKTIKDKTRRYRICESVELSYFSKKVCVYFSMQIRCSLNTHVFSTNQYLFV